MTFDDYGEFTLWLYNECGKHDDCDECKLYHYDHGCEKEFIEGVVWLYYKEVLS